MQRMFIFLLLISIALCLHPQGGPISQPFQPLLHQIIKSAPPVEWPMVPPNAPFRPPSPFKPQETRAIPPAVVNPVQNNLSGIKQALIPIPPQQPAFKQPPSQQPMFQPIFKPPIQPTLQLPTQQSFKPPVQPAFTPNHQNPLSPKTPMSHHHPSSHDGQPLIPLPQGPGVNFCPDGVRVRKEFRDLTSQEWMTFKNTLIRMYETKDEQGKSIVDRITKIHLDYADISHYTAHFLPWHRVFTWLMETEMRKIEPTIAIPYWDWAYDANNPTKSPFFNDFYLGTKRGPKGDCNWRISYPKKHCLVRNFKTLSGFYSRKSLDRIVKDHRLSYAEFAEKFEVGPHGIVHTEIGGEGGDMTDMMSPNDPAFWLHHSFVELVFLEWQLGRGRNDEFGGVHRGKKAKRSDWLRPFRISIADSLDHRKFCYTYQPFSRRLAPLTGSNSTLNALNIEEEEPRIPIGKLPLSWIEMHGMTEQRVREIETELKAYEEEKPQKADDKSPPPAPKKLNNSIFIFVLIVVGVIASIVVVVALYHMCSGDK